MSPSQPNRSIKKSPEYLNSMDVEDIEINDEFRASLDIIENNKENLFITGRAGTGKSTLLQYFRATTQKSIVVLAPTGLAAVNIGGQTIHSFFHFPPRLIDASSLRPRRSKLFRQIETLVIDEVSMVRADLMDGIDASLRISRGRIDEPFGGVQVIMIGDLFQLPPIIKEQELRGYFAQKYGGVYFFKAPVFNSGKIRVIELQKVYRQTNAGFIDLLNRVRDRQLDGNVLELLNCQLRKFEDLTDPGEYVTLTPTNRAASEINMNFLGELPGSDRVYTAVISGQFDSTSYPTDSSLSLKVGARVIMINNDLNKNWVNGTLGVIDALDPDKIHVNIRGTSYEIQRYTWENVKYDFNPETEQIEPHVVGTFQQYPMKLAWALTIHKSQGLTLNRVYLDLGGGAFSHGQTYVALSRCKSLEGIALGRPVLASDIIFDEAIYEYKDVFAPVFPS
jgi:ATP-dependent DNA helicase PIF1